jgi:hypothetical protein
MTSLLHMNSGPHFPSYRSYLCAGGSLKVLVVAKGEILTLSTLSTVRQKLQQLDPESTLGFPSEHPRSYGSMYWALDAMSNPQCSLQPAPNRSNDGLQIHNERAIRISICASISKQVSTNSWILPSIHRMVRI